jgi:hypothetical protein
MSSEELSTSEVDLLLRRFDETGPELQRDIVAGLVVRLGCAEEENQRLLALLREGAALQCVRDSPSLGAQEWKDRVRKEVEVRDE